MREKEKSKLNLNLEFFYKAGAIFFGIMLAITLTRNILIITKAYSDTEKLKQDIEEMKLENEELKQKIQMSGTEEFIEKEARDKLGLVKEGETVLVMPEDEFLKQLAPEISEEENTLPEPNWKKWLKLFM